MAVELELPSMVAGRTLADSLVERLGATQSLRQQDVVVDCRRLVSASPSFAAQFLKRILLDQGARTVRFIDTPAEFGEYVMDAAQRLASADRVTVELATAAV